MEVDFPRGHVTKKKSEYGAKKPIRRKKEKNLFMTEEKRPIAKKRKIVKTAEDNGKKRQIEGSVDQVGGIKIDQLSTHTMCPDMTLLGCISEIRDYKLIISLANNIKGVVSITDISDTYTSLLQQLAEGTITEDEGVHSLFEMFKVGMLVSCKISEIGSQLDNRRRTLDLSMNPKYLYGNKSPKSLKNNMRICASVVSKEDHGYILDIGIPNTKGFLTNKNAKEYIKAFAEGDSLMLGQIVWCCIQLKPGQDLSTDDQHTIFLNISPSLVAQSMIDSEDSMTYNNLMPGVCTKAVVKKSHEHQGLVIRVGNKICVLHPTHVNGSPADYEEDTEIDVAVLYVKPDSKSVYLTTLPHLLRYDGCTTGNKLTQLSLGDIIENAVVCEVTKKGVYMKLMHGLTGLAQKGNLSDSPTEDLLETFKIGSNQRCRVVGFNAIDNFVMLSMKQSIIEAQILSIKDIVPGQAFKVVVKFINDNVIGVKLGNLNAIIPRLHMADVPLKNPLKKFHEADELECRVLSVDAKNSKVILTNKKSLLESKLPILHDHSQIRRNLELDGVIVMINQSGVLVTFYNNVKGWVPVSELGDEKVEDPEKAFYLGQIMRCKVKHYNEETTKMLLSFRKGTHHKEDKSKADRTEKPVDFEPGKIESCKIKMKQHDWFIVTITSSGRDAILYRSHLSDFEDLTEILWEQLQEGDVLDQVIHFKLTNKIIVSMKPSLLKQAEEDSIPTDFSEISKYLLLPAVVKKIEEYGIFFTLTGGLNGLVPMKVASDNYLPYEEITNYIHVGQSIVVRITHLNTEKKTFVGSMLTRHCYRKSTDKAILMKLYLENKEIVNKVLSVSKSKKELLSKMKDIPIGSVVTAVVQEVDENGVTCKISNGLTAYICNDMLYDTTPVVGDRILGVLLSIDIMKNRADLSLDQSVVAAMKNSQTEDQVQQLNVDESIGAEIIQVTPAYYMVSLKNKALGSMAYVPTKSNLNCINELELHPVKHQLKVKIHSVYNESLIALTQQHVQPTTILAPQDKQLLSGGGVYKSTVTNIHSTYMELDVEDKKGIVHCTNMVDNIENNGENPFSEYKCGSELVVRILRPGVMPITKEKVTECTARPSQLNGKIEKSTRNFPVKSMRRVFLENFGKDSIGVNISAQRRGVIPTFDLSDDLSVLENARKHFKKGHGFNAEVSGCWGRSNITFTLTGHKEKVAVDETVKGYICEIEEESKELTIKLPGRYSSVIKVKGKIEKYRTGQWLWCRILSVDKDDQTATINIKSSRN